MTEERREGKRGETVCPSCGGKLVPILYGLPDPDAFRAAERGEVVLGGCLVSGDDPRLACVRCGGRFRSDERESRPEL